MTELSCWVKACAMALIIGLVACDEWTDDRSEESSASDEVNDVSEVESGSTNDAIHQRRRPTKEVEAEFTYFRYRIDVSENQPKACFVFSAALDSTIDYSPYVDFQPSFRAALSVDGRELCVGGLSFGDERTAILKLGLPAAKEDTVLALTEEVPISFEDRPAYVGFKGAGVILPRKDADGLPIETVNVDSVRITVSRVNDRALATKSINQGMTAAQGEYVYLWDDRGADDVATEVWSGSMPVVREQNTPVVSVFPLAGVIGELIPGAYFVRVEDERDLAPNAGPPATAIRWIVMTDLALTAYQGGQGLDVTLRSLQSGQSIANTTVQLIAYNNDILAETRTDAEGRVHFDAPLIAGVGNDAARMVMAYGVDGDIAVLDLTRSPVDLSSEKTGGRYVSKEVDAFIYTERGVYRPGETVFLTSLVRSRAGQAIFNRAGALVIRRPNGLEAARVRFDETNSGAFEHDYVLAGSAARGVWQVALELDGMGTVGQQRFSVEDFVPQRIQVELEGDTETFMGLGDVRDITADTRFLYGAAGAGLVVKSRARIEPDPSPFEGFKGFRFGEYNENFNEQLIEFPDNTTDGAGKAMLRITSGSEGCNSGRPLRVNTVVSVLEPGGRAVTNSTRIPYRPCDVYLGIKSEGQTEEGESRQFELVAVSANGTAVAQTFEWKAIEIVTHYDWYKTDGQWRWRSSRTVNTVNEGIARANGSTAEVMLDGLQSGQYELIVISGDRQATQSFTIGWAGGVSDDGVEAPDRVEVIAPEQPVVMGDEAHITVVPPYDGYAEIVVATDRVLAVQSHEITTAGMQVNLPVTQEWGEGAYVMVTVYSPHDSALQVKPRRALGVTYLPLDVGSRTFQLTINAPDIVRPRQQQLITVDIEGGPSEPIFLTLSAVDEGILQLTKFESPDAPSHYFGKKALGVSLYDDYGRLLDPNLGAPSEIRTGGDQLGGEGLSVVPVKSVALYSGIVDIGGTGQAQLSFDIPSFNGELRLMAVAWSETGLGSSAQPMIVRDTVPADLILPRFLAPGDQAWATASIDNVEGSAGAYGARLTSHGPVNVDGAEVSRSLQQGQRADEHLPIYATETGVSSLTLSVDGPNSFHVDHEYPIQTRSAFFPVTRVSHELMQPGQSYSADSNQFDGLLAGALDMDISFSSLPVDARALYSSLARYPYGCSEQVVSRALPLFYAEQLVGLDEDLLRDDGVRTRIQEAINTVLDRQSTDGAFGLWRESDGYASPWLGAYVADFLYRAKQQGYAVPSEAMQRVYDSLYSIDSWNFYGYDPFVWESQWHDDTQDRLKHRSSAFALYVLAKAGKADISRLRYLHDRSLETIDSPLARAHIAAALAHMGDRSRAKSAFAAAINNLGYNNSGDYYQTPRRDLAGVFALAAETGFNDLLTELAEQIGRELPEPNSLTTQEKAFLLLAVESMSNDGGVVVKTKGLGLGVDNGAHYLLTESQVAEGVSFTLGGDKPLFRTVVVRGVPDTAPPAVAQHLTISKRLYTLDGSQANLDQLNQGDQLIVVLSVSPEQKRVNPLIIADLLPAGFEIETVLRPADGLLKDGDSGAFAWVGEIDRPKTAEARDDRYVAAIDVQSDSVILAYLVRAVTPGNFVLPGAVAEDMYRPVVQARSESSRVVIMSDVVNANR